MKFKNIVFFAPCMFTGGAEYYFIRLAEYLAKHHKEFHIYYVEFLDGFARKMISSPEIIFLDYEKKEKTEIPENSLICFALNHLIRIDTMISYNRNNSLMMMWVMHFRHLSSNFTMNNYYKVSKKYRKEVGMYVEKLTDLGVLKFLGNIAYLKLSQQFLFKYHSIAPLPIPVSTEKYGINVPVLQRTGNMVRFCWLGRLDEEKSHNILTYMNELESINNDYNVSLSIIGVGSAEKMLKKKASKYSFPINFVGEKREENLDIFIRNNVDVGLASGTSSMEFALRKVPVIEDWLLERVYKANERDRYYLYGQTHITNITTNSYRFAEMGNFKSVFFDLMNNYLLRCEEAYKFVMTRSTYATGEKFVVEIQKMQEIDIEECYRHIDALNDLTLKARNNWMEKLHLRRLFVPICKLLSVEPAVI